MAPELSKSFASTAMRKHGRSSGRSGGHQRNVPNLGLPKETAGQVDMDQLFTTGQLHMAINSIKLRQYLTKLVISLGSELTCSQHGDLTWPCVRDKECDR